MSEFKLISPMLDHFAVGDAISDHHGVCCYPAMDEAAGNRYIVKVISIPASRTQLDALLLSGAYPDEASALVYFKELADSVVDEVTVLNRLSQLEGFLGYDQHQLVVKENDIGFQIYLLGGYKRTLARHLQKQPMTQLGALNLGLDMCAALTVCRRCGYLYADLKPENIYLMEGGSYRIGDLGFIKLDTLKYASLPDKYRNTYTAPEIADAFSELNSTMDVYAAGMILYQIYNNGELPVRDPDASNEPLAAPANADYEMAEIILKACAANPADRWEDPAQMGQALVNYMQRNGAHDEPIVPPAIPVSSEPEADMDEDENVQKAAEDLAPQDDAPPPSSSLPPDEELEDIVSLLDSIEDETDPSYVQADVDYDEVSEEITEIMTQADEIVSHPIPDPVVAPDPIDVPIPEPLPVEPVSDTESADSQATIAVCVESDESTEAGKTADEDAAAEPVDTPEEDDTDETVDPPVKKKSHWLRYTIGALVLIGLLVAAFFFYTQYYLLPIQSITLEGHEDTLSVYVEADIDESLLTVDCVDQHGMRLSAPVKNGMAVFEDLIPDTGYTVTVTINGFHKLTGDYSKAYSTPVETNIAQFSAVAGYEDGTVILAFTVEGRDASEWTILYSAEGEEEKSVATQTKAATISGLTIGKEYTFQLQPDTDLFVTGEDTIKFTASKLIYPQDLSVTELHDGVMTVSWTAPKGTTVDSWSVHCTDGDQYTQSVVSNKTTAQFENIDAAKAYTVTVTASGMSVNKQYVKPANAVALTNLKLEQQTTYAELTWDCSEQLDEDWFVSFSVDGLKSSITETTDKGYFRIPYIIPGTTYRVYIKGTEGTEPLGGIYVFDVEAPKTFTCTYNNKTITAEDMTFRLCTPPDRNNWNRFSLSDTDYTNKFQSGQKAGIVIQTEKPYGSSWDEINRVFAIYDKDNNLVNCGYTNGKWNNMWSNGYCHLDIPFMPESTGEYTLHLFFDGQLVTQQPLSIVE